MVGIRPTVGAVKELMAPSTHVVDAGRQGNQVTVRFPWWGGGEGVAVSVSVFSIQKVHCCTFPGGAVTNVVGTGE